MRDLLKRAMHVLPALGEVFTPALPTLFNLQVIGQGLYRRSGTRHHALRMLGFATAQVFAHLVEVVAA